MAGTGKLALGVTSAVLVAALVGCGDGGGTAGAPAKSRSANGGQGSGDSRQAPGRSGQAATGGPDLPQPATGSPKELIREFPSAGGSLTAGYREASGRERAAASESVEAFMAGREDDDLDAVCNRLSARMLKYVDGLVEAAPSPPDHCPEALALALDEYQSVYSARNTMTGPIDGLLVKGASGIALYHGREGADYLVDLVWEDGGWKVDTLEVMGL